MAIAKDLSFFALVISISTRHSLLSALLMLLIHSLLKLKFWIFLLIRWLNTVVWLEHTPWCMAMNCPMAMSQTLSLGVATQS